MFELFKYFIYVVRGSLDNFDPVTDMLVDSGTYLTWRRYNDDLPAARGAVLYAGAVKDTQLKNWIVLRFNRRLYYEGVEHWLESQSAGKPNLGIYQASEYRGLFREQPPHLDIAEGSWHQHKLPIAEKFFSEVWGVWPAWLGRELEAFDNPTAKWDHVRHWLIKTLLGERGVRA
jgi:hypothetical protein